MPATHKILIFGASYGSLLATKLLLGGHSVKLVCLPEEAELINREGTRVRLPVRETGKLVEIDSRTLSAELSAGAPSEIDVNEFDLVALGMQEPQYGSPGVRELVDDVAKARIPAMSIMNMPPLPFLERVPGVSAEESRHCYTDPTVWENFDSSLVTLCSPDPQAFRPPDEQPNVLQVSLPTNFKAARFDSDAHTAILRDLESSIDAIRYPTDDGEIELPVKLRVHESVLAPLAKWAMLVTGNYRCIQPDGMRPIREAVHEDIELSRSVYGWVVEVCERLGASHSDVVPFEKYAAAAEGLSSPSSVARASFAGAANIERVDCLVKSIAEQLGMQNDVLDEIVQLVDSKLETNRRALA